MIASNRCSSATNQAPSWQARFSAMLPLIRKTALISFRKLTPELRDELVQELIANCTAAFARLTAPRAGGPRPSVET